MGKLEYGSPEHRDCVRDVLAMLEQALAIQTGAEGVGMARENLAVLLSHAQIENCLTVALSMLASSWQMLCHVRAQARGTSVEQEIEQVLAAFRERMG